MISNLGVGQAELREMVLELVGYARDYRSYPTPECPREPFEVPVNVASAPEGPCPVSPMEDIEPRAECIPDPTAGEYEGSIVPFQPVEAPRLKRMKIPGKAKRSPFTTITGEKKKRARKSKQPLDAERPTQTVSSI